MSQPSSELSKTCEEIYTNMLREFSSGIKNDNDVHPAFIGEVGCSWPIHGIIYYALICQAERDEFVSTN